MQKTYKVVLTCTVSDKDREAYADNIGISMEEYANPDEFSDENLIENELSWAAPSLSKLAIDYIKELDADESIEHAEGYFDIDLFVEDLAKTLVKAYDISESAKPSCEDYKGLDFESCTHLPCKEAFKKESLDRNSITLLKSALKQCIRLGDQISTDFHSRSENSLLQKFLERIENKIENI